MDCLLTKRLITLHPPETAEANKWRGLQNSFNLSSRDISLNFAAMTIQIERISLVVRVLAVCFYMLLSSSCKAHKFHHPCSTRICITQQRVFMTLTAGPDLFVATIFGLSSKDRLHLARYQHLLLWAPSRLPWNLPRYCTTKGLTTTKSIRLMICRCYFSFAPRAVKTSI